jgi:hypothetical protein
MDDRDVIGIDLGITMLGVKNTAKQVGETIRSGRVKKTRVRERTQPAPLRKAA